MTLWDSRKNNLDLARLAFATLVIFSHAYPLATGVELGEPFAAFSRGQVTGGAISVDAFFILSGFLITASAERSRGLGSFLRKRILRIYPAFAVCALVCAICVLPLGGGRLTVETVPGRVWDFVQHTLRLTEFSYAGAFRRNPYSGIVNGSVWSIPCEFLCYLGVGFLMVSRLLRRRFVVLALFVAIWLTGVAFRIEGWVLGGGPLGHVFGPPQLWARLLPLYMAGVVFYLFRERIPLRSWLAAVALTLLLAANWFSFGWAMLFPLAGTYLLLWLAFTPLVRVHEFGRFGDFSYGTYLYAFPVEQLVMKAFGHPVAPWVLFCCATPLTFLAAVASWYGVERRFLAPARRKETVTHVVLDEVRQTSG